MRIAIGDYSDKISLAYMMEEKSIIIYVKKVEFEVQDIKKEINTIHKLIIDNHKKHVDKNCIEISIINDNDNLVVFDNMY